jgi:hypothetical protein
MPRKARPAQLALKDFSWSRAPKGYYRLWNDDDVQRVIWYGAAETYKPLDGRENPLGQFASLENPEGVLDFIRKFGPLTPEGMDDSKGENVESVLQQARLVSKLLRAAGHKHSPLDLPEKPTAIGLTIRIGESGPEEPFVKLEPRTLLDAIWLQLAHVLTGDGEIRHCLHCGVGFAAGGQSGRRQDAKFCSDEHRVAYNNQRRIVGGG